MPVTIYQPENYKIMHDRLTGKLTVYALLPAGHGSRVGTIREENGRWLATRVGQPETEHATQDEAAGSLLENVVMRLGTEDEQDDG